MHEEEKREQQRGYSYQLKEASTRIFRIGQASGRLD
jgi:hypothetical protein